MRYFPTIGLEVHAQLNTKSKIFCSCENSFGKEVNTTVCPICMGLPGTLPVLNGRVVELAIKAGISLNCTISKHSYLDRKNYFYPDLPKAYQISQDEIPLCLGGYIELENKKIRIKRIHIEEDAGKLIHNTNNTTTVDFNRCGVPLIEIVTEPDITSADEAIEFLKSLKLILEYTGVSDCKMQEGSLRCDVNISLSKEKGNLSATRCEIKNLNSFTAIKSAIEYEIKRQSELLASDNKIFQETLRWDGIAKKTIPMRSKETSHDYRYFPEPDLLPLEVSDDLIDAIKKSIPKLADARKNQYIKDYNLTKYDAEILTSSKDLSDFFEETVKLGANPKQSANWLMGDVLKVLNEKELSFDKIPFSPIAFKSLIDIIDDGTISLTAAKQVLVKMFETDEEPKAIVLDLGLSQLSDENEIKSIIDKVIKDNPQSVLDFHSGKDRAFGFLVGQAMKESRGKANPKIVNELLKKSLEK